MRIETENQKKKKERKKKEKRRGVTPRKSSGGEKVARREVEETEYKRQPAVTVKSNWNLLMKFTLVTIKLSGLLAY